MNDYNFGTLIRINCEDDYTETNSMFGKSRNSAFQRALVAVVANLDFSTGLRVQFLAIEILRNRRGMNDFIYEKAQAEKTKAKTAA